MLEQIQYKRQNVNHRNGANRLMGIVDLKLVPPEVVQ
jgi:hypothetical protein